MHVLEQRDIDPDLTATLVVVQQMVKMTAPAMRTDPNKRKKGQCSSILSIPMNSGRFVQRIENFNYIPRITSGFRFFGIVRMRAGILSSIRQVLFFLPRVNPPVGRSSAQGQF